MVEPADRRGYNAPNGWMCQPVFCASQSHSGASTGRSRPRSTSMSGRIARKGCGLSRVWRTGGRKALSSENSNAIAYQIPSDGCARADGLRGISPTR